MFPTVAHTVFEHQIKLEPLNFYGCPEGLSETPEIEVPSQGIAAVKETTSKAKPQECKVCGKILSSPSSYYVHMKLHSGNKPYHCTLCDASFCRKPYLEVHMRTHTGERPFQCDHCSKRFTQKSSLNTHKRVHTGERPYSCDLCGKQFAVKSYLMAHQWSHVADRPLRCNHCGKLFTSKNQFFSHMHTHSDKRYECSVCRRTFVRGTYLLRHQMRVHMLKSAEATANNGNGISTVVGNDGFT